MAVKTPVHDVAVNLHVLVRRADVDPVAAIDVGDERLLPLDERRKKAALDRPRGVLRNAIEGVGFEDVDAGVDRVAGDVLGLRLFEKTFDAAVRVGFDEAVGGRIRHRREHDGRLRFALAVQRDDGPEIDFRQHVTVEDHDRFP